MNVFELFAKLSLDSSAFESGLSAAQRAGASLGSGLMNAARIGLRAVEATTVAVGVMGASSVKAGAEFDESMSQVAATMGKTMDEMQNEVGEVDLAWGHFSGNLREYAQEMGRNTAFSATQAAEALNYMALAGYDAQTSMNMLPNVLNLAAAGAMDLGTASDMVTDAQTALGLSLAETNEMVDQMAKVSSTTNTSVSQLGEAMLTIGGTAQFMSGGTEELTQVLGLLADNGIKGSEAGTHLRNMLLKLSSPTSDAAELLGQFSDILGHDLVFDKATGEMRAFEDIFQDLNTVMADFTDEERIQAFSELFNTRDVAAATALLGTSAERWEEVALAIDNAQGSAAQMAKTQLDNLAGDITLFKSALEGAKIAISDKLTPSLRDLVKFGTDGLSRLTDAFTKDGLNGAMKVFGELLSEGLDMVVKMLPEFVDGGVQLLEALGKGIIDNLPTLTAVATEIISRLGTALSQNLPGMIQAGSDILSGLLNAIIDNLDTITPLITDFIVGFAQIMTDNADKMIEVAIAIASAIGEGLIKAAPIIAARAPEIIDALTNAIAENPAALIALGPTIIGFITKGIRIASPLIKGASKLISTHLGSGLTTTLPNVLSKFGTALSSGLSSAVSFATADMGATFAAGGTTALATAAAAVIGSIISFFAGAEIGKKLGGLIFPDDEDMYDAYSGIVGTLTMLKDLFFAVIDYVKFEWEDFIDGVKTDATNAWTVISTVYGAIGDWFEEKFNDAKERVSKIWDAITLPFELAWEAIKLIYAVVADIFEGNFQDAYDRVTGVWDAISDFFEGVWTDIKNAFHLDEVYQWGKDLVNNFSKGIKDNIGTVVSAVTGVSSTVSDYLHFSEPEKGPLADFHTFAPDMIDLFTSGLEAGKPKLESALDDVLSLPTVDANANVDYNSSVASAGIGVGGTDIAAMIADALAGVVVEVNIGTERLDDMISTSIQRTAYRSGGR